jgi:hypothetical protein
MLMLELTQDQVQQLRQLEHAGFVRRVQIELVTGFAELAGDQNLEQRLLIAHDQALNFGLESAQARTQFLYQEAFAPGFYERPAVSAWLRRAGAEPEQRWRDFMALATARLALDNDKEQ